MLPRFSRTFSLIKSRSVTSLVIAEHNNVAISQSTLATITAAKKLGGDITMLVTGKSLEAVSKAAAAVPGISKVIAMDHDSLDHNIAENLSKAVVDIVKGFTHVLTPSSNNGKNFLPRVAALSNCSPLSDVIAVIDADTFQRPIYAGNAISTVKMSDSTKFLLIRPTAFDKAAETGGNATIETMSKDNSASMTSFVSENQVKSGRPDLTSARVVVSGGRGMKNGENFAMLETLADKLGGAVGASRAAVDAGYVPNDMQIGQTGKVVAPELYIAVGISGAIQHLSGMKDSKTIVAINKDKDAPIFQVADYGLVDDLFKVIPEMNTKL